VRPVAGSIVASPVLASWDPDPDYFFHWFRDSAIVIDAVRLLYEAGHLGPEALTHFTDFVHFSLSLQALDGRRARRVAALAAEGYTGVRAVPARRRSLAGVRRCRFTPTRASTPTARSTSRVGRAPSTTARRCEHWPCGGGYERSAAGALARNGQRRGAGRRGAPIAHRFGTDGHALARAIARYLGRRARPPLLHAARRGGALSEGADWLRSLGEAAEAAALRAEARAIRETLDDYWLPREAYYRSRVMPPGAHRRRCSTSR
jgi:glucoamylase